jgi:hypothetical protein
MIIDALLNILCFAFSVIGLIYTIKLYRILKAKSLFWLMLAIGWTVILRLVILIPPWSHLVTMPTFVIFYFLFAIGLITLYRAVKRFTGC